MGKVSDDSTFSDNDWEEVKEKDDDKIRKWIDEQMGMRSCIVVLIGETTSTRKWVKYEIEKAYELNKGMVGIYIHNLNDQDASQTEKGKNPFDSVYTNGGEKLSKYVTCFDPVYSSSKYVYDDKKDNIEGLIEDALNNKAPRD